MYLMMATRPDIAFAVAHVSKFCADPSQEHWLAAKHVMRYLRGTSNLGLRLESPSRTGRATGIVGFSDADWSSDSDDRKSVGAYAFFIGNCLVSWSAKKQAFVATSTMESEYAAASQAAREGIWIWAFLGELTTLTHLRIPGFDKDAPVKIYCDNEAAIRVAKNSEHHKKAKHIDISIHFLRQRGQLGHITMEHIPTERMVADFLTKPLPADKFIRCRDAVGLVEC